LLLAFRSWVFMIAFPHDNPSTSNARPMPLCPHQFGQGSARFAPTLCQIHQPGRSGSRLTLGHIGATALVAPLSLALAGDRPQPPISIGAGKAPDGSVD